MTPLQKRLQALEAKTPKVDTERCVQLRAAMEAMYSQYDIAGIWERSEAPPHHHVDTGSLLDKLWARIKDDTLTEADRAAMASWPKCHLPPEELVEAVQAVRDKF